MSGVGTKILVAPDIAYSAKYSHELDAGGTCSFQSIIALDVSGLQSF